MQLLPYNQGVSHLHLKVVKYRVLLIESSMLFFAFLGKTCSSNPCKHGTCNDTASGFNCNCEIAYTGALCDTCKSNNILIKIVNVIVWLNVL